MKMKTHFKVGVVLTGYVVALLTACLALGLRHLFTAGADVDASGGMYAFGDLSLFVAVFGFVSLAPSGAAAWFLRSSRPLWVALSIFAIAIAFTGAACLAAYVFARYHVGPPALREWAGFAPLRMLSAPLIAAAFLIGGLIAPHRGPRVILLTSCASEIVVCLSTALLWFGPAIIH